MRLIDADALWKEFCRSEAVEERYGSGVLEITGDIIDNATTVDAVQVVRCKDCVYYQDNNDGYPHNECRWRSDETPDADDFCSMAERERQ